VRIKGLMSTAASRAWVGVAIAGIAIVVLVFVLSLLPRLTAGQQVIDTAKPAFADGRVDGTRAAVNLLSQYVDFADPLMTARGGADKDARRLVRLIRRELGISSVQARRILHREAPHTEALTRALPLSGVAAEIPALAAYLASTLTLSADELAGTLEQSFPRLAQLLTTLPNVTDGWNDVPGIEGLTRLSRDKPVRTVPGLRKYLRDDVVPLAVEHEDDFQGLAGSGGIGYIPFLLLVLGLALLAYGVAQARRAATTPPGTLSWSAVVGVGVFLIVLVVAAQYFPRLSGGQELIDDFEPVFAQQRVEPTAIGLDTVHEAVLVGDPIMTRRGGAARETPRLYRLVAQRTGRTRGDVRRSLSRRAPRTIALLDALPLTKVGAEAPRLVGYLSRALHMPRAKVRSLLRRRAPRLAQVLLAAPAVTSGWEQAPGTGELTRFDGVTPVTTMPAIDDYLRQDLVAVFVKEREHFETLAGGSIPIDVLGPALLIAGVTMLLYGGMMMQLVARAH
jgi:hypothetical protein